MKTIRIKATCVAAVGLLCQLLLATENVPTRSYSNKLTLDVPDAATLSSLLAARGISDLSGYDCLEKTGAGVLTSDVSIAGFAGDILIKAGAVTVMADNALGNASVQTGDDWSGFVSVEDGASLIWGGATSFTVSANKTVYLVGTGYDDMGAVQSLSTAQQNGTVWGKNLILVGDAKILAMRNNQYLNRNQTIRLNGHRLTVLNNNNSYSIPFRPAIVGPGQIECTKGILAINSDLTFSGTAEDEFIMNGGLIQYGGDVMNGLACTLVIKKQTTVRMRAVESAAAEWPCPVRLEDTLVMSTTDTDNAFLKLSGVVTGSGAIAVRGTDEYFVTASLTNPNNVFTGGVSVEKGELRVADGALPETSALQVAQGRLVAAPAVSSAVPGLWYGANTTVT